jgi:hypothetical protein
MVRDQSTLPGTGSKTWHFVLLHIQAPLQTESPNNLNWQRHLERLLLVAISELFSNKVLAEIR